VEIYSILPTLGPASGASVVTVTGAEFLPTAMCLFGTSLSPSVTFASSTLLSCLSPAHGAAFVALEVSVNGQNYTQHRTQYQFYGMSSQAVFALRFPRLFASLLCLFRSTRPAVNVFCICEQWIPL